MKKLLVILLSVSLFGCSNRATFKLLDYEDNVLMEVIYEGESRQDPNYVLISKKCWDDKGNEIECEGKASEYWDVTEQSVSE